MLFFFLSLAHLIDDTPQLSKVLKLLFPLRADWAVIGSLLGIDDDKIDAIEADQGGVSNQLRKMLREWFKCVNPEPSWKKLIDVVELIDQSKSLEIQKFLAR